MGAGGGWMGWGEGGGGRVVDGGQGGRLQQWSGIVIISTSALRLLSRETREIIISSNNGNNHHMNINIKININVNEYG